MVTIICLSVVVVTKGDKIYYLPTLRLFHTQKLIHALFFCGNVYIYIYIYVFCPALSTHQTKPTRTGR
jgi:hypothetical protein